MITVGVFVSWYAQSHYNIGTLTNMGPGFFPASLGTLLTLIGFFIGFTAFFRSGKRINIKFRTLFLVSMSIVVFAGTLKLLGIVLATMLAVAISSMADNDMTWQSRMFVAIGVAFVAWLIFILGLSMVLPVWPWSP